MPPTPELACEVGHAAPGWTEAVRALESPTEGRCVVAKAAPAGSRVWSLCGGFVLGRLATAPAVCPVAPGGLAVKRVGASSASHPWGQGDAAFTLDCAGRYELAEVEGKVSLTLAATGAGACGSLKTDGSVAGWPQPDPTGLAILPVAELPADVVELLPAALRGERYADIVSVAGTLSATLVWQTGPLPMRVAGFDLAVGRSATWQALDLRVEGGRAGFSPAPVRFRAPALRDARGEPVELTTWADIHWSASESSLSDILPVNLPASRACGASIPAGKLALVHTEPASASQRACRRAPSTPPDSVSIGPDHVYLDWNVVPEALRTAKRETKASTSWQAEVDQGCDIVCR